MNKVSVIIATYNAAGDLQNCLDSFPLQVCDRMEIVIADGASQDGTLEIIRRNSSKISQWISEPDQGVYDAMNKALQVITGSWVYFLGADDLLLPDFVLMLDALQDRSTIYYGNVLLRGKQYLGLMSPYYQAKTGICHQAMIYPRSVFMKYTFDLKYQISADHHLNMKCHADPAYSFRYLDLTIARFNHTGLSSLREDQLFKKHKASLIRKYFGTGIWLRFMFRELKWKFLNRKR